MASLWTWRREQRSPLGFRQGVQVTAAAMAHSAETRDAVWRGPTAFPVTVAHLLTLEPSATEVHTQALSLILKQQLVPLWNALQNYELLTNLRPGKDCSDLDSLAKSLLKKAEHLLLPTYNKVLTYSKVGLQTFGKRSARFRMLSCHLVIWHYLMQQFCWAAGLHRGCMSMLQGNTWKLSLYKNNTGCIQMSRLDYPTRFVEFWGVFRVSAVTAGLSKPTFHLALGPSSLRPNYPPSMQYKLHILVFLLATKKQEWVILSVWINDLLY